MALVIYGILKFMMPWEIKNFFTWMILASRSDYSVAKFMVTILLIIFSMENGFFGDRLYCRTHLGSYMLRIQRGVGQV